MKFAIEHAKQSLSGESSEYQIEVNHGGWGGQLGDRMLVSVIVRTVKRTGPTEKTWEADSTLFLSLDRVAADWLRDALAKVSLGEAMGLKTMFS